MHEQNHWAMKFPFPGSTISAILEILGACPVITFCPGMMGEATSWEACILVLVLALLMASYMTTGKSLNLDIGKRYLKASKLVLQVQSLSTEALIAAQNYLKKS